MAGHVACGLTRQRATWRWQAALRWTDLIETMSSSRRRHQQLGGGGGGGGGVNSGMYDESKLLAEAENNTYLGSGSTSFRASFKCLASTNKNPERVRSDTINQERVVV
uniref:Uncharacterized protein n=1 Tax=Oryza glumipatula TaxID=40148 RepID=A0A0D9YQE2_9ORYZ